jgi:arylsulfatase A-like enzyme
MKKYLRCVAAVDENVGRLLDYLKKENLVDNTIVVFTSDQGMFLGEHNGWTKQTNYNIDTRVPLLVRAPGAGAGGAFVVRRMAGPGIFNCRKEKMP